MDNALLLIVGRTTDKAYLSACKKAASRQHNIFFLGEIKDMLPIYAHSDFVVRSDPDFRIGRTIFEGLYAGCGAILPGSDDDVNTTQELIPFKERVFCYAPGDFEAFAEQLKQCEKLARPKRTYESNVPEYIQSVTDFLLGSISS
jgi:glycosyltransferase involved in cell wall biosynthesis